MKHKQLFKMTWCFPCSCVFPYLDLIRTAPPSPSPSYPFPSRRTSLPNFSPILLAKLPIPFASSGPHCVPPDLMRQGPSAVCIAELQPPNKMPNSMPAYLPDRMPEYMSNRMLEYMPDRMLEHMSDRMPEYMLDRMSEFISNARHKAR